MRPHSGGWRTESWIRSLVAIALVATLGAFAYRFAAPRNHDFAGALDQAEGLLAEGRLAEAGSLLLGRIAPDRMDATPEESLRYETVHQAWLDAVKAAREAKRTPSPAPVALPSPAPPPDGEAALRLAEADAEAGRHEAARMRFESALSLGLSSESGPRARLGLAEAQAAIGDHAAARGRYSELGGAAAELDPAFRELAAGSVLDRLDAMLALGEFEAALGYAEVAGPLVVAGSSAEASLAIRRASTRLALANRLAAGGDRETARPLARAAAVEFLGIDGPAAAAADLDEETLARLAGEAMRIVSGETPASAAPAESIVAFLRAEMRRDAGLAASRALLAATPGARPALIEARLESYASALADYDAVAGAAVAASEPGLAALAASRAAECLVALNRVPEAIARLERLAAASSGTGALEPIERALELARHTRDAAAVDRLVAAGRAVLDATPDASLAAGPVRRARDEWRRTFAPTGLASVPAETTP